MRVVQCKMKCDKRMKWCKIIVFCCVFVLLVCDVKSEGLQCTKRHILGDVELDGLLKQKCTIDSEGQNLTNSDCTVWDLANDGNHDCKNLQFTPSSGIVSGIEFFPYMQPFPNLNITFKNIQWRYMQYRVEVGDNRICHKLRFNNSLEMHEALRLSFTCQTFGWWAADVSAEVLVDLGDSPSDLSSYAHYVMKIPPSQHSVDASNKNLSIKDWYVMVAVDVSHKPDLLVYWPVVPDHYNVSKYILQIGSDDPEEVTLKSCKDGYCSHKMFAGYLSRNISVSVQPDNEECWQSCYSSSPLISIEFLIPTYFIVMIVLIPILIVVIVVCSTYYFCCAVPQEPLKVLLLHEATTKHHHRVVRILAEYLKEVCRVHCLMSDIEIPKTESQNPSKWLHKTINEVDAVLYVASPPSHMDLRFSEYPGVVCEALSLIQKQRSCPVHLSSSHYLVAVPPYCSKENIPKSLLDVPRFYIPDELSWLLWSLYNQQCWMAPFTWMGKIYLKYCWCPGPMSAFPAHGIRLSGALAAANAKQTLDEELPVTPASSRRTIWTRFNGKEDENDNRSMPYTNYPGYIHSFPLLGQVGGSLISEDDVAPVVTINLDGLDLQGPLEGVQ